MNRGKIAGALAVAMAVGGPALADDPKPAETPRAEGAAVKDVAAMIIAFEAAVKDANRGKLIGAIGTLAEASHKDVVRPLARFLGHADPEVAGAAAGAVGEVAGAIPAKERGPAIQALLGALGASGSRPGLQAEVAKALGKTGDVRVVGSLVPLVKSKDNSVAKAAVEALATAKHESSIEPLISELTKLEWAPKGNGGDGSSGADSSGYSSSGGAGYGAGGSVDSKRAERIKMVLEPIQRTLQAITKMGYTKSTEWRGWWKNNKATFRVPQPESEKKEEKK
ncbi:MAG: HEAT repeat domain-containing protein [Planctomycetales bacterium]|nr:HEAT repeat domain-containing protein [Planctomycetales bacterium]